MKTVNCSTAKLCKLDFCYETALFVTGNVNLLNQSKFAYYSRVTTNLFRDQFGFVVIQYWTKFARVVHNVELVPEGQRAQLVHNSVLVLQTYMNKLFELYGDVKVLRAENKKPLTTYSTTDTVSID